MLSKIFLSVAAVATASTAYAANDSDETPRRWAVIAGMNISCPTVARHGTPQGVADKTASFGSPEAKMMLEYWLPNQHFSVVGGYNAETLEWYGSDVSATMRDIALGARYYPLSTGCAVQPYAALMTYTNVGTAHENSWMEFTGDNGVSYKRDYTIDYPRLSVTPSVGFDCYIFSSLALEFQYGFSLAVDGKTRASSTYGTEQTAYPMLSDMHRHNFQIGLKATFPFHFTTKDVNSLFDLIYMALGIYDPDDEPHKETKKEIRKKSLNRVIDSY